MSSLDRNGENTPHMFFLKMHLYPYHYIPLDHFFCLCYPIKHQFRKAACLVVAYPRDRTYSSLKRDLQSNPEFTSYIFKL